MKRTITNEDYKLTINGKVSELRAKVYKTLESNLGVIVIVGSIAGQPHTPVQNIFMISNDGRILWQIEEFKGIRDQTSYYTNVFFENGKLHAFHPSGFDCEIDLNTGRILRSEFTK